MCRSDRSSTGVRIGVGEVLVDWRQTDCGTRQECAGRLLRSEHVQRRVLPVLGDDRAFSLRLLTTVSPDDADQPPFIAQPSDHGVIATFGHLGINWRSKSAQERPTGTNPPRRSEDDNCVRSLQAKVERFMIVAVGDPGVGGEEGALLHPPLIIGRLRPSGLPIVEIEMYDR